MARSGINKALVQRARDALLARGEHPSIEAVRVELGNTGSKSTILRYLQELKESEPHRPPISISEELQTLVSNLAQRLVAHAQMAVAADRDRLQQQQTAYEQQHAIDLARFEQLQTAHEALTFERREAQQRESTLNHQIQHLEGERQRLLAGEQHQQLLLEERTRQITSLEEKHQHARDALAHYRQQHLMQREQELQRHDQQVQHLQLETRRLQEQLMSKQEELAQIYRDLERMTRERQIHATEMKEKVTALQQRDEMIAKLQGTLQAIEQQARQLEMDYSVLREKARRFVLDHRAARRVLRIQAKQLSKPDDQSSVDFHSHAAGD